MPLSSRSLRPLPSALGLLITTTSATLAVLTLALVPAPAAHAQTTLAEYTQSAGSGTFYPGQSVTTAAGGPFNNITFNFFSAPDTPAAAGNLYLFTSAYSGSPNGLSTSGYTAKSTGISGGIYLFDANVTLLGETQYFFYADAEFLTTGDANGGYGDGDLQATDGGNANYIIIPTQDANFRLRGTPVTPPTAVTPEASSVVNLCGALLGPGVLGMVAVRKRQRQRRRGAKAA